MADEDFYPVDGVDVAPSPKWVRVRFGDRVLADSRDALLVRMPHRTPRYAFPEGDVATDLLSPTDAGRDRRLGKLDRWDVAAGERRAKAAVWTPTDPTGEAAALEGHVVPVWGEMDRWLVEDEEARAHARDPWHRIDAHASSRHVEVEAGGVTVADSHRPVLLFETGLPVRCYLPKADVDPDRLVPSETRTECAYKGRARHHHVETPEGRIEDAAWEYAFPNPEFAKIQGRVAFYVERVDAVVVDGELRDRAGTRWGR